MNALDITDHSSCWNSEASPQKKQQILQIMFRRKVSIRKIGITFQGGFAGESAQLSTSKEEGGKFTLWEDAFIEPEDRNEFQEFDLPVEEGVDDSSSGSGGNHPCVCHALRIAFGESTDFYGRITIYRLEVWGYETEE
mmetsp:Transcript_41620/g.61061  ORF Transcript_41620/g.61061 Transcript_41620/m.61061 type:complete len:138 (+) Transcript_41620:2-415(+)